MPVRSPAGRASKAATSDVVLGWYRRAPLALADLVEENARIRKSIKEEFEQIEPEERPGFSTPMSSVAFPARLSHKLTVRRGFAQILTAILLIIAIGGHWAILQSIAWAGMIVKYSQTDSVKSAFSKTFDGKHPCAVCKFVREGKQTEQTPRAPKIEKKLDPWIHATTFSSESPEAFPPCVTLAPILIVRSELPPLPPPRGA